MGAQCALGYAYRNGTGMDQNECHSVKWFRKAAAQGDEGAQRVLRGWDTTLGNVGMRWQVIFDPNPRASVVEVGREQHWIRGSSAEDEQDEEAYEGESQEDAGMVRRMSPYVVYCELDADALMAKVIDVGEVRAMAEEAACRECGCDASVVTSVDGNFTDDVYHMTLRVRLLASGELTRDDTAPSLAKKRGADDGAVGDRGSISGSSAKGQPQEAEVQELTVCCSDGTSHKLAASPSTTVLEVKQHVRRTAGCGANAADAEEERALPFRPFCWQDDLKDEHAARRQYVYKPGMEDELADVRSMASLGNPPVLFLILGTEELLMDRLEAEAVALRGRLEGVKLRDLARCDNASMMEEAWGVEAAGGAGAGSGLPCKKHRAH